MIPEPARQLVRGFAMGAADIVPGVSGGTVALVVGIYERLIDNVHLGAQTLKSLVTGQFDEFRRRLGEIEWMWLVSLLVGILAAVAALSSILETLLHDEPIKMSALFLGLVLGTVVIASRLFQRIDRTDVAVMIGVAVALFLVLGLRSDTEVAEGTAEIADQPWYVFFGAGALAICAMILPGISGSFILVMIGMYTQVLGAVNDRNLTLLAATAAGAVIGLALFSTVLKWALDHYHDVVIATMIGLMLGSVRVLWPWPGGTSTTTLEAPADDVIAPVILAIVGFGVVVATERLGDLSSDDTDHLREID